MNEMSLDEMQRQLRKYRKSLSIGGEAILAFGVWSLMKYFLEVFMSPQFTAFESVIKSFETTSSKTGMITTFTVIALIFAVVLLFFISSSVSVHIGRDMGSKAASVILPSRLSFFCYAFLP